MADRRTEKNRPLADLLGAMPNVGSDEDFVRERENPGWAPGVLALDLEGTLISNAVSQIARPGLQVFLTRCRELFPRVVVFTTVPEDRFRDIARTLVEEGLAPSWFTSIEYVQWSGPTKDLNAILGARWRDALLVDDFEGYVHPGQESQWVRVEQFAYPYPEDDTGLESLLSRLSG